MDFTVFAAVLLAALFHAGWNAMLKLRVEPLLAITLVSIAAGLVAVPLLAMVPFPNAAAWPFILGSLAIHLAYYLALGQAYRAGDLGQVYPIARGGALLLTALLATLLLGERLGTSGWLGIALLTSGVAALSLRGGRIVGHIELRAVGYALLTAATISVYTIIDGVGARMTDDVLSYITWLFVLDGLMMLVFGLAVWRNQLFVEFARAPTVILFGGTLSAAAYAIALWAMTQAPVALVAALRETSVLFAAVIGMIVLREPVVPARMLAAVLVIAGVVLLRLR